MEIVAFIAATIGFSLVVLMLVICRSFVTYNVISLSAPVLPSKPPYLILHCDQRMCVHKCSQIGQPLLPSNEAVDFINLAKAARKFGRKYFTIGTAAAEAAILYGQANIVLFARGEEMWIEYLVSLARDKGICYFFMEPNDFMKAAGRTSVDALVLCIKDRSFSLYVNQYDLWRMINIAHNRILKNMPVEEDDASDAEENA